MCRGFLHLDNHSIPNHKGVKQRRARNPPAMRRSLTDIDELVIPCAAVPTTCDKGADPQREVGHPAYVGGPSSPAGEKDAQDGWARDNEAAHLTAAESSVDGLLLRTAVCLTALLHAPTARAGLNESRYNLLDALRRKATGTCSQTELATQLLQSESNLSTLLERMRQDGLITRVRSESDRRVTLIALATAGREALARADRSRTRAAAPILGVLNECGERALGDALGRLVKRLELALGIASRSAAGTMHDRWERPTAAIAPPVFREPAGGQTPAGFNSTQTAGATS